ncbi:MAG: AAA family ATPase [Micromonosporaceae bacterium]
MNTGGEQTVAPFTLPGPASDRETAAGWARWRTTRRAFMPAPRLTSGEYRALSPRGRMLHDLHRAATHANLAIQETPMSAAVSRVMWSRLQNNALKHKPTTRAGLMINGGGYQGKTETACEVAAAFEDQWLDLHGQINPDAVPGTRDLLATVAYVQTPVTATPKSVCEAILGFYGAPYRKMTLAQLVAVVRTSLYEHATKVLILDDVSRLRMHREADRDALDLLRSLMSMHVTLVLIGVGIPQSGLLREGQRSASGRWDFPAHADHTGHGDEAATQTQRRFDLVELGPFRYDTPQETAAWVAHLAGIEAQLRLLHAEPGMLTAGTMPEYLFRRTGGIVGLLERLIEDGCGHAIDTGAERLTDGLLDGLDINLGDATGRDEAAGEVPDVPPRPATSARSKRGRARNKVFDDKGITSARESP